MSGKIISFFSITFNPEDVDNIYLRNSYICLPNSLSGITFQKTAPAADIQPLVKQRCLCFIGTAMKDTVQTGLNWLFFRVMIIYLLDEVWTLSLQNMNQTCRPFDRHVWYQIFEVGKESEKFLIQILHLGGGFVSIKVFVSMCAVCISTHRHSVPQSLLSIKKHSEAVCSYALFSPNIIFLSKELKVILNDNIVT